MKITALEPMLVALPPRRPHHWTGLTTALGRGYVLLKVHTDEGLTGLGEAPVLKDWGGDYGRYYGESPQTTLAVLRDYLGPAVVGQNPLELERVYELADRSIRGYPYAKAALDVALHDLAAKALGIPVYQLLGGRYRDRVAVAHSIGLMEIEEAVHEAAAAVEEGITTLKLKVGQDQERDVRLVREVRRAVGAQVRIRVDANQGYPSVKAALGAIRPMEEEGIWFVEQPVEGIGGLARIARALSIPVMADESAWTPQDVLEIIAREAAEMVSLYYTKPGGLRRAQRVAALCEAAGLPCDINGSLEMGVGNAANLHLAAATPIVTIPGSIPITQPAGQEVTRIAGRFYLDDIVKAPFRYQDGHLLVPEGPGLGVELDEAKVERYRIG